MEIPVETGPPLPVVTAEVAGLALRVRGDARSGHWDVEVSRSVLERDQYGLEELAAADSGVRWILDIGAHVGSFTLKAKRLWPGARVVAAEPDPDSAQLFRLNTRHLEGVRLEEAAILGARAPRRVHLRQGARSNADRNAASSRVGEVLRRFQPRAAPATTEVAGLGILELLRRHGCPRVDLLKLDCEAAEGEILADLSRSGWLRRIRWIRGEWHFRRNLPIIERALARTHRLILHPGSGRNGLFEAAARAAAGS